MALVGPLSVVKSKVVIEADSGIPAILICLQIHFLIFHRPSQPLNEQVVAVAPFSVHADSNPVLLQ